MTTIDFATEEITTYTYKGTSEDDVLYYMGDESLNAKGNGGNDSIMGNYLDDSIQGNAGDDSLSGFSGNDVLKGGRGDDIIFDSSGIDTMTGGKGADTFEFALGTNSSEILPESADVIKDFKAEQGDKIVANFQTLEQTFNFITEDITDDVEPLAETIVPIDDSGMFGGNWIPYPEIPPIIDPPTSPVIEPIVSTPTTDDFAYDGETGTLSYNGYDIAILENKPDFSIFDNLVIINNEPPEPLPSEPLPFEPIPFEPLPFEPIPFEPIPFDPIFPDPFTLFEGVSDGTSQLLEESVLSAQKSVGEVDPLTGVSQQNIYQFNSLKAEADNITNFRSGVDQINISADAFGGDLTPGVINAQQFVIGKTAADELTRFVYNSDSQQLIFDADGSGEGEGVVLANFMNTTGGDLVTSAAPLAFSDLVIV